MRLLIFYLLLAAAVFGIMYASPEFRQHSIKNKRRVAISLAVPVLLITFIYFMEVIINA